VVDPFAGGGSIPLEALRVGADAFASDLNPVAVLLNKVVLEYIPKYGQRLADEVRKWGEWMEREAEKELRQFYPQDADGATPIAYLWARTIRCEGPGCGAEVPLIRSLWLAKKANRSVVLQLVPNKKGKRVDFRIITKLRDGWVNQDDSREKIAEPKFDGTVKRGSATCPSCGYTTAVARLREQIKMQRGGANDARMFCVVTTKESQQGREFRLPVERDMNVVQEATKELERRKKEHTGNLSLVPDEQVDIRGVRHTWAMIYGLNYWSDYFKDRQLVALTTLTRLVERVAIKIEKCGDVGLGVATQTILALGVSRIADIANSLCTWKPSMTQAIHLFARQAIPMTWDFAETSPLSNAAGDYKTTIGNMLRILEGELAVGGDGKAEQNSACEHRLPDDSVDLLLTDPPYYDAVPYAYLADFFYVWLRRSLSRAYLELFATPAVPKDAEIVVDRQHELSNSMHDIAFYERELTRAFAEGRRIVKPGAVGTIVFASKTTASWEAILKAVVDAGWIITGSWPIDTEMETRVSAQGQARLASSVHLVCRPRENPDGSVAPHEIGDWRDVLQELPRRIHEWMPRLAEEGVVGADAIFACLGPALEIFSRYLRVEKASGAEVALEEYLEQVWGAVAREAMSRIFEDGDATGFEEDARLTAIWFWVMKAALNGNGTNSLGANGEQVEGEAGFAAKTTPQGFMMEYDAARKLAQGLGVDLQRLSGLGGIVLIKGNVAMLNSVAERERYLLGDQLSLFGISNRHASRLRYEKPPLVKLKSVEQRSENLIAPPITLKYNPSEPFLPGLRPAGDLTSVLERLVDNGSTVLDRLHQAMLLFARSQNALLRPFLVETYMAIDQRFWRLAQVLSALYPMNTDEKRWVDGVLAKKRGLGF
jgi:putative DNA methylase